MTHLAHLILFAGATGLLLVGCTATPPQIPRYTIEQFMDSEHVVGASFSHDGSRIAFASNRSGVVNLYVAPFTGGEAQPLTHSQDDAIFLAEFFPHDDRLLYISDRGGDEITRVYLREPDGTVRDLVPGEGFRVAFYGFSGDGTKIRIGTNERDPSVTDIYELDADTLQREMLVENTVGAFTGPTSPDGRYVTFSRVHLRSDTDILLFDRETGRIETMVADEDEVANAPTTFSADSAALYYLTDRGHEFRYLVRRELSTGEETIVYRPDWDVMFANRSRGGAYLVLGVNEDSRTTLRLLNAEDHTPVPLPPGNITWVAFSADDTRMAYYINDSRSPSDLFVTEPGGTPRAVTRSLNPDIDAAHLVDGEVIRFESYDGLEVPGILYRPRGASTEKRVPAMVMVHGGPGGQARIAYRPLIQYLVNHGYAVFDINNRGSSGYGRTFFGLDTRCHGECDLGDVVASKQMLIDLGWVDPDRIGIIGGSYGGFMVAAALAFEPEVFDVGVNIFGVTNWIRTLESIPQ